MKRKDKETLARICKQVWAFPQDCESKHAVTIATSSFDYTVLWSVNRHISETLWQRVDDACRLLQSELMNSGD
jgi:hypothetical protein